MCLILGVIFFFFKQKTAYEMRISDWSSDVCSSDLLAELAAMARNGARDVMLYLVQRGDCDHFRIAADIDLGYATALAEASEHGVEAFCYACAVGEDGIELTGALPVDRKSTRLNYSH